MLRILKALIPATLLVAAGPAFAHPGHDPASSGFVAGLLHPLLGLDHLLAMIVVGVWAAQLEGRAMPWVPASFVALMAIGAGLSVYGFVLPEIEAGIAASLLVLGLLVAMAQRLPLSVAMMVVGCFALFHGAAHGSELPALESPVSFATGFLLATATLHVAGVILGRAAQRQWRLMPRVAGALTAATGLAFAFA